MKVYAANQLSDLFDHIDKCNEEKMEETVISMDDLTIMKNHIEDLEMEAEGNRKRIECQRLDIEQLRKVVEKD